MNFVGNALLAHAKGGCYTCLRGDNLVDLDIQIEGEGALVLCRGCIQNAAEAASLTFNEAAMADMRAALERETADRIEAQKIESSLQAALNKISKGRRA